MFLSVREACCVPFTFRFSKEPVKVGTKVWGCIAEFLKNVPGKSALWAPANLPLRFMGICWVLDEGCPPTNCIFCRTWILYNYCFVRMPLLLEGVKSKLWVILAGWLPTLKDPFYCWFDWAAGLLLLLLTELASLFCLLALFSFRFVLECTIRLPVGIGVWELKADWLWPRSELWLCLN